MSCKSNSTTTLTPVECFDPPFEGKFIAYDCLADGEYAMFLDRQFLGYASSYSEAEQKIAAVYRDQLTHTRVETADHEADACLPFEPTEAELQAYAQEWDAAVADAQAALDIYAQEWDAALPPQVICAFCKQVKDDLSCCNCDYQPFAPTVTRDVENRTTDYTMDDGEVR